MNSRGKVDLPKWKIARNLLIARVRPFWREFRSWSFPASILRSPVLRIVALIPALGYTVLYSNQLHQFLDDTEVLGRAAIFSQLERMHLLFFGAMLVLVAFVIYLVACPEQVRRFKYAEDYANENLTLRRRHSLTDAIGQSLGSNNGRVRAGTGIALNDLCDSYGLFSRLSFPEFDGEEMSGWLRRQYFIVGGNVPEIPKTVIARFEDWFEKENVNLFDTEQAKGALTYLFESHYDHLRFDKNRTLRWICVAALLIGLLLFFAPTVETVFRIAALYWN